MVTYEAFTDRIRRQTIRSTDPNNSPTGINVGFHRIPVNSDKIPIKTRRIGY